MQRQVYRDVRSGFTYIFSLKLSHSPVDLLAVQLITDAFYVTALCLPEYVAGASELQIAHRQLEACAEFREFPYSSKSLSRDLGEDLARLVHQIRVGKPA